MSPARPVPRAESFPEPSQNRTDSLLNVGKFVIYSSNFGRPVDAINQESFVRAIGFHSFLPPHRADARPGPS
jgi:hypothetical protein